MARTEMYGITISPEEQARWDAAHAAEHRAFERAYNIPWKRWTWWERFSLRLRAFLRPHADCRTCSRHLKPYAAPALDRLCRKIERDWPGVTATWSEFVPDCHSYFQV